LQSCGLWAARRTGLEWLAFEVTDDLHGIPNLVCIQLRADCEMWHKENLINVGVRHFPAGWRYGGYWDSDFHCTRHDWALEATRMLQHHQFVPLFSSYADLTSETASSWTGHRAYRLNSSRRQYGDRWHILRDDVRRYFLTRQEDDPTLQNAEATLA